MSHYHPLFMQFSHTIVLVGGGVVPVADVAGPVLVQRAARPPPDPVNILVALGRVLGEVDPSAEHPTNVGVSLVEALMDDGVDKGGAWGRGVTAGSIHILRILSLQQSLPPRRL